MKNTVGRQHYFIKLGARNFLFDFFLREKIGPYLIIGHGGWTIDEYLRNTHLESEKIEKSERALVRRSAKQISNFMESRNNRENTYFWVFYDERIFALQATSEIFDLKNYHDPKFRKFCEEKSKWEGEKSINKKNAAKFNLWADAKLCEAKFVDGFGS